MRSQREHVEDEADIAEGLQRWQGAGRTDDCLYMMQERAQQRWPQRETGQDFPDDRRLADKFAQIARKLYSEQNDDQLQQDLAGEHDAPFLALALAGRRRAFLPSPRPCFLREGFATIYAQGSA